MILDKALNLVYAYLVRTYGSKKAYRGENNNRRSRTEDMGAS